jgi:hypothetical protein
LRHQKLDVGTILVGLGALGLIVSLFLHWYSRQGITLTAWDVFEFLDWALLACAVVAIAGVAITLTDTAPRWLAPAAIVALYIAISQVIDPPPLAHGATREVGAWLGLGSAAAMAGGVALAAASIAITVDVRGRERRRRVAAVDRRDAAGEAAPPPPPERSGLFTDPAPAEADPQRTQPLSPVERDAPEGGTT